MSTIKDVAKYAGVSVATVSRVLNKKGPLSEKSIQKVNEALVALDYYPNLLARALVSGKNNNTIGVILPSFSDPFWSKIAQELENSAKQLDCNVIFSLALEDNSDRMRSVEYLRTRQVDGIILTSSMGKDHKLDELIKSVKGIPLALLVDNVEGLPSIVSDDAHGGLLATRHLIAKGCRNIVHISGDLSGYKHADARAYSFIEECKRRSVTYKVYENKKGMSSEVDVQNLVNKVFYENPDMDGLFLSNDILAMVCIRYALSQGMRIPDDIRIIGYDDINVSSLIYPPLTTIHQRCDKLAMKAVQCVLDQMNGKPVEESTIVPVELIERKTT